MMAVRYLLLLLTISFCQTGLAEWEYNGHAKLLLTQSLYQADDLLPAIAGDTEYTDTNANLRFNLKRQWQSFDLNIHYQMAAIAGDSVGLSAVANPFSSGSVGSDAARLFNLAGEIDSSSNSQWLHRIDRLNLGYSSSDWVMRIGRQAISWGNGISFHPLDIFNPFSPVSLDTEYKTGDDLVYLQWLLNNESDLQLIYLPRRDPVIGVLDSAQDSLAMKMHLITMQGEWDLLLARHYDEMVYGLGYVRNVSSAIWRTDINLSQLQDGRDALFVDTNMDYSWNWFQHNIYGYVEWFHNSLGQTNVDLAAAMADVALKARLTRGELYTLAKDTLSIGMMMELSPRWQANMKLLHHPGDGDSYLSMTLNHDWRQDASLILGMRLPCGVRGSEYGGLYSTDPVSTKSGYIGTSRQLFLYIQYYY